MVNMIATYKASGIAAASHTDAAAKAMTEMLGRTWDPQWIAEPAVRNGALHEITHACDISGVYMLQYEIECTQTADGSYSVSIAYMPGFDLNIAENDRRLDAEQEERMKQLADVPLESLVLLDELEVKTAA